MKRLIILILVLLVFTLIAHAQGDTAPWLPDPSDIFAEEVEVVSFQINEPPVQSSTPTTPLPAFDNDARVVRVYDDRTGDWREYPYPEEVTHFNRLEPLSDGALLLVQTYENYYPSQEGAWLLDVTTGEFSLPEAACGVVVLPSSNRWHPRFIYHTDPRINRTAICDTATGEMLVLIPPNMEGQGVSLSPNGEWLMLFLCSTGSREMSCFLYSFELSTGRLLNLGQMPRRFYELRFWINDYEAVIYVGEMPEWGLRQYLRFDLRQPNSLEYIITGWAEYHESLQRFDYIQTYFEVTHRADPLYYPNCAILSYSLISREANIYDLGQDCFGDVEWLEDVNQYYYLTYAPDGSARLALFRLDMTTGEQTELAVSEDFLALESVSLGGRYAALRLNQQNLDLFPYQGEKRHPPIMDLDPFYYRGGFSTDYVVVDTLTGQIVYEASDLQGGSRIEWFDNNHFVIVPEGDTVESAHVFQLDDGEMSEYEIQIGDNINLQSIYREYAVVNSASHEGVSLVSLIDSSMLNLIQADAYHQYRYHAWVDNEGKLLVRVSPLGTSDDHFVIYTIRLP